ncbi:MAG: DUF2585 domain-containing protein [Vicinamibacterales bacterium]
MSRSQPNALTASLNRPSLLLLITLALLSFVAIVELAMGRQPICACGTIKLWHGVVNSSENSQQISHWYTFTHVLHGLIFYAVLARVAPGMPLGIRFLLAVAVEGTWELAENSPFIIDRYRAATISLDYYGDSVLNSVSDIVAMMLGFAVARRAPVWVSVTALVVVEVLLAVVIRDNLTLNIIMLIHPVDAIKTWQLG